MTLGGFYDGTTLGIVLGGTVLATFLRCGWGECRATLGVMVGLFAAPARFEAEAVRARLARIVQEIARDGLLRAQPRSTGDAELDAGLHALVGQRSVGALKAVLTQARGARLAPAEAAMRTLMQAAELAPVFGLAGTLISLSRLPANGIDRSAYMGAIGMAVHATLYGLILANLLFSPLARLVERRARAEEGDRQAVVDWFEYELAAAFPSRQDLRHGVPPHPAQFAHTPEGPQGGETSPITVLRAGSRL